MQSLAATQSTFALGTRLEARDAARRAVAARSTIQANFFKTTPSTKVRSVARSHVARPAPLARLRNTFLEVREVIDRAGART